MNVNTLFNKNALWPNELNNIDSPPKSLFVSGTFPSGARVGVIGSRRPTAYGSRITESLVADLIGYGIVVVSGLAIGIDGIAHKSAIEGQGRTIAVLPAAIDAIYPARHAALAQKVAHNGCLISEYTTATKPQKHHFIARNRIIAALSDVLVVVEASQQSGTMHTVRFAQALGKEIGAIPGRVGDNNSRGTNSLIKQGAHLIDSAQDVALLLGLTNRPQRTLPKLNYLQTSILEHLEASPASFGELSGVLGCLDNQLRSTLSQLELYELVAIGSDGRYSLRSLQYGS